MENSIYYTFSTIPQVLAGAIALLGVFLLFKLKIIDSELEGYGQSVIIAIDIDGSAIGVNRKTNYSYDRLQKAIVRHDLTVIKKQIDIIIDYFKTESMRNLKTSYENKDKRKNILIAHTKRAIKNIVIVICISVGIIPFTKLFSPYLFAFITIFFLVIVAFISCLILMIKVIYESLTI